jgi:luciferase family oxidoreductase group 1
MIKLSVLDQSVAVTGREEDASIRETLALASYAESLGYNRFWVSEHHGHPSIVGSAPEILMAAIAATTKRIRIGSAGVMLPHYATLKVAEQFRVLDALAPGRIDLGVGRAPGSDFRTSLALNPNSRSAAEHFPAQIRDLQAWITDTALPVEHPARGIAAHPTSSTHPDIWVLGSSDYGAQLAAAMGLPYAFAHFITDGQGAANALNLYRTLFQPGVGRSKPEATICVWALAADSEAEAWRQWLGRARWKLDRGRGRLGPMPSPEEVVERGMSDAEHQQLDVMRETALVGSGAQVAGKLRDLAEYLQVDEIVVITWAHDPAVRRRSYELLAQEFGLGDAASEAASGAALDSGSHRGAAR